MTEYAPLNPEPRNANPSPMESIMKNNNFIIGLALLAAVVSISLLSPALTSSSIEVPETFLPPEGVGTYANAAVQLTEPFGTGPDSTTLPYIHCGQTFSFDDLGEQNVEIILLHGVNYNKDDWAKSGILTGLCMRGGENISVTAVGLSVHADDEGFRDAFNALVKGGVISGHPAVIITPSASGKAVVRLVVAATSSEGGKMALSQTVSTWIPIASPSVMRKTGELFKVLPELGIKVLAINGDDDIMGSKVTQKLIETAGAKGIEITGGHTCYFERPEVFVENVLGYLSLYTNATFL